MAEVVHSWRFASGSGSNQYETLRYDDGSTSCNCMGWTIKRPGQERQCKHTRSVYAGQADRECIPGTSLDMRTGMNVSTQTPIRAVGKASTNKMLKPTHKERDRVLARKITWTPV